MRFLNSCLLDEPLPRLTAIADAWDIALEVSTAREMAEAMAERMLVADAVRRAVEALPDEARDALGALVGADGRMPAAAFERRYGGLRPMGPGRLERERPWLNPANATETLWYRGFLYRGFDRSAPNPIETLFVPDDLLKQLVDSGKWEVKSDLSARPPAANGCPSPPTPYPPYDDALILDDITTLLIHIQNADARAQADGAWRPPSRQAVQPMLRDGDGAEDGRRGGRFAFLTRLIARMGWLKSTQPILRLSPQPVMAWLQQSAASQMSTLYAAWRDDAEWNDLAHIDGLAFDMDHAWSNNPLHERTAIVKLLSAWAGENLTDRFSISGFAQRAHDTSPDFARVDGRYDTWHIRDVATGDYLNGFENWERVEGALIRYILRQPLRWLELLWTEDDTAQLTELGRVVLSGAPLTPADAPAPGGLRVAADGIVTARGQAHFQRFQLARVADWVGLDGRDTVYRLMPASLARGREQGIQPARVGEFLQQHSETPVPPSLLKAIHQWAERGTEARLETAQLLRARDSATLDAWLGIPAIRSAVIERLSPTCAAIRARDAQAVATEIMRSGLMVAQE